MSETRRQRMRFTFAFIYENGTSVRHHFVTNDELSDASDRVLRRAKDFAEERGTSLRQVRLISSGPSIQTPDELVATHAGPPAIEPPPITETLCRFFIPPKLRSGILGDLNEDYVRDFRESGKKRADRNYRAGCFGAVFRMVGPWLSRFGLSALSLWLRS